MNDKEIQISLLITRIDELEQKNARLREALNNIIGHAQAKIHFPHKKSPELLKSIEEANRSLKGSEVFILKKNSNEDMNPVMKFLKIKEGSKDGRV
jgi:hypothetical protein